MSKAGRPVTDLQPFKPDSRQPPIKHTGTSELRLCGSQRCGYRTNHECKVHTQCLGQEEEP